MEKKKKKIELEFDRKLAVESLGDVKVNQWCRVLISGWLKNGAPFGAEQKIKIRGKEKKGGGSDNNDD